MSPYSRVIEECQLRLSQELKNYQTEIYQMKQSIEQLKAMVLSLAKKQDDQMAKMQTQYKASEVLNEHFTEYVKEEVKECKHVLDGYRNELQKVSGLAREAIDQSFNYTDRYAFYDHQKAVVQAFQDKQVQIESIKVELNQMCNRYTRMECANNTAMNHLESQIPNLQPLRDYVDQNIKENSINMAGLVREIEICKNRISYGDKKFENIYTLLERKGKT